MYEQVVPGEHLIRDWRIALTTIYDPLDLIRQYCGLTYRDRGSEVAPETWAFAYFDEVPFPEGDLAGPIDVLASGTLSATARFEHLEFFIDYGVQRLRSWVKELPRGVTLDQADDALLEHVGSLNRLTSEVPLSLLSKVAFRLRPDLIPIYEASTASLYRMRTDGRGEASWPALVREIAKDVGDEANPGMSHIQIQIASDLREKWMMHPPQDARLTAPRRSDRFWAPPSKLRLFDIAVFMAGQFGFHEPERFQRMNAHLEQRYRSLDERASDRRYRSGSPPSLNPYSDIDWRSTPTTEA